MICSIIDNLIVNRPIELLTLDVNPCYYIDGPHDGSGRPLGFPTSTSSHYYRLHFEMHNPDSELVISREADTLSVSFVPSSGKYFVYLVHMEPVGLFGLISILALSVNLFH